MLFLVVLAAGAYTVYAARREHLRAPWRQAARSRTAMAAAVVLSAYVVVALADSVHCSPRLEEGSGYAGDVVSLFDRLVVPLRERTEKTYSAPFAVRLYAKETARLPDGIEVRTYPRLVHGGAHLDEPERERAGDIAITAVRAPLEALAMALLVAGVSGVVLARHHATTSAALRDALREARRTRRG